MTNTISASPFGPATLAPLRAKWGWIVALGVVYVVAGFIALGSVVAATVATVYVVGIMMPIAGVVEVVSAFQMKSWGKFFLWLILGALYIVAGFVAFENPLLTAVSRLTPHSRRGAGALRASCAYIWASTVQAHSPTGSGSSSPA